MKLPSFEFTRARSPAQAIDLLAELGSDAKILAGGQSLIPLMSFRLAAPAHLVDVSDLRELSFVRAAPGGLEIGGTTRHATLETESLGLGLRFSPGLGFGLGLGFPLRRVVGEYRIDERIGERTGNLLFDHQVGIVARLDRFGPRRDPRDRVLIRR